MYSRWSPFWLEGTFSDDHNPYRADQYVDIQPDRIIFHVINIFLGMQVHHLFTAPVHLPPTGDARRNGKPPALPVFILLHQVGKLRARADQAHFTLDDIDDLRDLIKAEPSQDPAQFGHTGIIRGFMNGLSIAVQAGHLGLNILRIDQHGPEFEDIKSLAIFPNSLL